MQQRFPIAVAIASLAALAQAQVPCFESNRGPNLSLGPPCTQHRHRSAVIHPTCVLRQATQAHPGTNSRGRTPKAPLRVVAAIKVDPNLGSIATTLRLAGCIEHEGNVPFDIADGGVDLGTGDTQHVSPWNEFRP